MAAAPGGTGFDPSTLSGNSTSFEPFDDFDETVHFADGLEEGSLFPTDWDHHTPPYDSQLYAAPVTWDAPQPKVEPVPMTAYATATILTPAQQEKLRQIAMPNHLQYRSSNSPKSTSSKSQSVSSPESASNGSGNNRKRKSSIEEEDEDEDDANGQHLPVKKTAHNMIEKRYRTNLNDKIAALRDSVPSLRIMSKSARGEDTADDREELQGLTPAHKLNKATVLSKATEYINHLEKRNKRLQEENAAQKARLAAFETLFRSGSMGFSPAPMNNPFQFQPEYSTPGPSPTQEPQGMIHVPDDIRRLQTGMNQQIYQVPQEQYRRQPPQPVGPNGWQNGGYFGKLMVGTLAGLMIMEGFSEAEQQDQSTNARGLLALPTQLLRGLSHGFHSSLHINFLGYHSSGAQTLSYLKTLLVIGALVYVYLPSLFITKSKAKDGKEQNTTVVAAPSLASPIQVRRRAWLTAIQTVWVPRHNFFLEAAALCLKMLKLSMRNVVGTQGYAYITGITQQQEAARVKAWTIALDAQLAGGDAEINMSRLTLTLLASGTLPDSPARLMLKALHIRVLLWEVGNAGFNGIYMFHEVAAKMARWKWNDAKTLQRLVVHTKEKLEDELPEYLAVLLEQNCDDVLSDAISQRAYNLAWDLPTSRNSDLSSTDMDSVVDDFAIRSPLDAVAAWYSSSVLQRALIRSLEASADDVETYQAILEDITLAIRTAPIGSAAQIRALVARAVVAKEKPGFNISAALKALEPVAQKSTKDGHNIIQPSTFVTNLPDIKMALRCAMAIAHLDRYSAPANPDSTHRIIRSIAPAGFTLLSFAATFKLMEKMYAHPLVSISCSTSLENLAGSLRMWIGGKEGEKNGVEREARMGMVDRCLDVRKRVLGMVDAGYESMSDDSDAGEEC